MDTTEKSDQTAACESCGCLERAMRVITRVKGFLLDPEAAWREVREQSTDTRSFFTEIFIPLAAVPPICGFLGALASGGRFFFGIYVFLLFYLFLLAFPFAAGFLIQKVAGYFGGMIERDKALLIALCSLIPLCSAGVLLLVPALTPFFLLGGLYGALIFIRGAAVYASVSEEQRLGFNITSLALLVLAALVLAALLPWRV